MCRLVAVHREEAGEREEQRKSQTGQGVAVDIEAPAVRGGDEARVGDHLAAGLVVDGRGLEVQEHHGGFVLGHHDVEEVQIVEDHTTGVDRLDGLGHQAVDAHGPLGVLREPLGARIGLDQRMTVREEAVQRPAFDELQHQEGVLAEREPVVHLGGAAESGESFQRVPLPLQPGHGVRFIGGQSGVRPCLLQHHPLVGPQVPADVDATAVGEVQRLLDLVREVGDGGGGAGGQMRLEELREGDPLGDAERRLAAVGDQLPLTVLDGGAEFALVVVAVPLGEAAVAHIHRTGAPAQIAEDVRSLLAGEQFVQLLGDAAALLLVGGVDREELSAGAAVGVFGVADVQQVPGRHALEGDRARDAVVPDLGQHAFGVVQAGGDMDLPALAGEFAVQRAERQPVAGAVALPALRQLLAQRRVLSAAARAARGQPVGSVVELSVGVAEDGVTLVHRTPPRLVTGMTLSWRGDRKQS